MYLRTLLCDFLSFPNSQEVTPHSILFQLSAQCSLSPGSPSGYRKTLLSFIAQITKSKSGSTAKHVNYPIVNQEHICLMPSLKL